MKKKKKFEFCVRAFLICRRGLKFNVRSSCHRLIINRNFVSIVFVSIAAAPSTPKSKYHGSDSMYNTPKSHHIHDDDSDSSPYSLSISQRAIGVEVTWGEKTRSTPFKSKYVHQRRDTDSPPTTKPYVDDEPVNESPKGLFKFMLAWERRRIATQIEDDVQRISDETAGVEASNDTNASASIGGSLYSTATEQVESSVASVSDSPNFKQLLNDSVDMDLMLCSQQIEQEVCSGSKTLKEACRAEPAAPENRCEFSQTATASKGFSEFLSDNDGKSCSRAFVKFTMLMTHCLQMTYYWHWMIQLYRKRSCRSNRHSPDTSPLQSSRTVRQPLHSSATQSTKANRRPSLSDNQWNETSLRRRHQHRHHPQQQIPQWT